MLQLPACAGLRFVYHLLMRACNCSLQTKPCVRFCSAAFASACMYKAAAAYALYMHFYCMPSYAAQNPIKYLEV
jgi:hypothetical protein